MNQTQQEFQKSWDYFTSLFKGKLIGKMEHSEVELSTANVLLKQVASDWFMTYGTMGKWLTAYKSNHPEKGDEIEKILRNEMKLSQVSGIQKLPSNLKYIAPVVGGAVGGGISKALSAKLFTQVTATILPAVLMYPVARELEESIKGENKKIIIKGYLEQLNGLKKKIEKILEQP